MKICLILSCFICYILLTKSKEVKQIKVLNKTHFSCDENKILKISAYNDDFCDCEDGSDENRTNACINGKFSCKNRFYEPKIISTSKVNDGICDCCDGSDEFNLGCPKTCLDLSQKEYDKLMDNYLTLKMIVMNFNEENYKPFFKYNKNVIKKIIFAYNELQELIDKKFLLKSYLHKMEIQLTEENENFVDSNNIGLNALRSSIENINEKIRNNEQYLNENENLIKSFELFSIFKDVNEDCHKIKYKYYECEMCTAHFKCSGNKGGSKYRHKYFGNMVKFENNVMNFENGSKCFYYNKQFSAKVFIECGSTEELAFKEKINGCQYNFIYTTKLGCNSYKLNAVRERINLFLNEIK